jgi:hypothetical protein
MNIDNDHTIHHIRIVPHEEAIWAFEVMIGEKVHVLVPGDQKLSTLWQNGVCFSYGYNTHEAVEAVGWPWFEASQEGDYPEEHKPSFEGPMEAYFYSPLLAKAYVWMRENWKVGGFNVKIEDRPMIYGPDVNLLESIDVKAWVLKRMLI